MLPGSCGSVCLPARCPAQTLPQDGGELAAACAAQLPPAASGPPADAGPPSCSPRRALPISSNALSSNSSRGLQCLGEHRRYKIILPAVLLEKAKNLPVSQCLCLESPTQALVPMPLSNHPPRMLSSGPRFLRLKMELQRKTINSF